MHNHKYLLANVFLYICMIKLFKYSSPLSVAMAMKLVSSKGLGHLIFPLYITKIIFTNGIRSK